jgi:hypothetical protein
MYLNFLQLQPLAVQGIPSMVHQNQTPLMPDIYIYIPGASQYWICLTPNRKKIDFGGWCGIKRRSGFCRSGHFGRSGVVKNVQKAFKKLSEAFWSGNKYSGVFFLILAKLIDFGFGVEISTIKRNQVCMYNIVQS